MVPPMRHLSVREEKVRRLCWRGERSSLTERVLKMGREMPLEPSKFEPLICVRAETQSEEEMEDSVRPPDVSVLHPQ